MVHLTDGKTTIVQAKSREAAWRASRKAKHIGHAQLRVLNRIRWAMPREFYLPEEARGKAPIEIGDLQVWTYERTTPKAGSTESRPIYGAIAFAGKAQKPLWHFTFRSEEERDKRIVKTMQARRGIKQRKEAGRKEQREYHHDYKVGDIFSTSWGYDQTNVDFYEVVDVRGAILIVRKIGGTTASESLGGDKVVARPGSFIGPFESTAPELGQFVEEEHAVLRKRYFARSRRHIFALATTPTKSKSPRR